MSINYERTDPDCDIYNDDVMLDAVTKYIADKEKFRSKSYLVGGKGNPTIGYGLVL